MTQGRNARGGSGAGQGGAIRLRRAIVVATLGAILTFQPVPAPANEPGRDFTFRRVAVPQPGGGPRITVQIDPAEQAALLAVRPALPPVPDAPFVPGPAAAPVGSFGWYWDVISPDLSAASPARLEPAVAALAGWGDVSVPVPRLQPLQALAQDHATRILTATVGTRVSPALVLAVISVESAGRADAVSSAGATGLMQLMPATAARFGVSDATDPDQNIRGGVAYLDWLMGEFGGDPLLVLAGYNAGEGAVRQNNGVPPYAETRDYVPKVLAAWSVARGLCLTPPELLSDGCVFALRQANAAP